MIRWLLAAYLLGGAIVLVGVCAGAVARAAALDRRLDELENEAIAKRAAGTRDAAAPDDRGSPRQASRTAVTPSDLDVDQLLVDLEHVSRAADAAAMAEEELVARLSAAERSESRPRNVGGEILRLKRVRSTVAAYAVGPAIASLPFIGVSAAFLPASDGMLLANLQLNSLLAVAGIGGLAGLLGYAAAAFRAFGRRFL